MNKRIEMTQEDAALRERLQRAVRSTTVPPGLEMRVRAGIRDAQKPRFAYGRLAMAATLAVTALGGVIAYQLGHLRLTTASQESYIDSVSNHVASIMRVGLRDHIHCAVFRKYPQNPPRLDELSPKLSPEYRPLIDIVRKHVPPEFRLMVAHECRHRGRRFIHLALKSDSRLMSLVLTRKADGESFATEQLIPSLSNAGIPMYRAGAQKFQIGAFESDGHLAYLISDLPGKANTELLLALATDVKAFLASVEG